MKKYHWNILHHAALALIVVCLTACALQPDLSGLQLHAVLIKAAGQQEPLADSTTQPFSDADLNTLVALRTTGFIENHGQFDERVCFAVLAGDQALWVTADSLWLTYDVETGAPVSIQLRFVEAAALEFSGLEPLPDETLTVWGAVRSEQVYPGMDLEIRLLAGELDYRWIARETSGPPAAARVEVLAGEPPQTVDSLPLGDSAPAAQLVTSLGEFSLPVFALDGFSQPVFALDGENSSITTRVSVASDGTQGNDESWYPSISADGRFVVFGSYATNLVPGNIIGRLDIFVHDRQTGQTTRVSVASDGSQANGRQSHRSSISADGRFVAFGSYATNLVLGDTNDKSDIFVHDRETGQTTRVSVAGDGSQGNGSSLDPFLSADGRFVAFKSSSSNLVPGDTNNMWDVFVHDRQTGQTTRVSVASDGSQGNDTCDYPSISADGRFVVFSSYSTNLVPGDTNNMWDVFVHDRETGQTTRVSVASDGTQANDKSYYSYSSLSADGRFVAFGSYATNLVPGGTNGKPGIFVHDRETGLTTRASVSSTGRQANDPACDPSISANGRFVVFGSYATNLVPGDTNNRSDIFVHDRQTGRTMLVSVAGDGSQGNNVSSYPSLSADGCFSAFRSYSNNLVAGDTNGVEDIFVRDLTAELVDPGFRPNPDGFAFDNYSDTNANDFNISDVRDLFGYEETCLGPDPACAIPRKAAKQWYIIVSDYLSDGHCDGMAVTSLRLFVPDYEFPRIFDSEADNTYELELSQDVRRYIAKYFIRQTVDPVQSYKAQVVQKTPAEVLEQLIAALPNEVPDPTTLIMRQSGVGGHTLTPYAVEEIEEGVFHIRVYDNNHPGDAERFVIVNTALNTWSYDLGGEIGEWSGDASTHTFGVVPISEYEKESTCPWCESTVVTTILQGAGSLLVENALGQRLGYQEGQLFEEIEDGYLATIDTGGTSYFSPQYVLPAGAAYQYNLSGAGLSTPGEAAITQFGSGYVVRVEQIPVSTDTVDQMEIGADGMDVSYRAVNAATEIDLQLIAETETHSRQVRITGADVGAGEQISLQAPVQSQTVKLDGSLASGGIYDFSLDDFSQSGESHSLHRWIALDAGDTHYLTVGESDDQDQLTLEIDRGSDGSVDEVQILKNQFHRNRAQLRTKSLVFEKGVPTLHLSGSTASPCNMLQVDVAEADGDGRIAVEVYSMPNPNRACAQVATSFEQEIPLGDLPSGSYTVWVNGEQVAAFDMP